MSKIGDEFYTFIVDCKEPKACTILLRGASKDVLNEVRKYHAADLTQEAFCNIAGCHVQATLADAVTVLRDPAHFLQIPSLFWLIKSHVHARIYQLGQVDGLGADRAQSG